MGLFDDITSGIGSIASGIGGIVTAPVSGLLGGATNNLLNPIRDKYGAPLPYSQDQLAQALSNSNGVYNNQSALASALQAQAQNGAGPVQQITNQNMEHAAQQGAESYAQNRSINPGLAARLSGNQSMQARAAAAGMGAQAQMASQGALGNLYGSMGQQGLEQQNLETGGNLGAERINAGVAQTNTETGGKIMGGLMNGIGGAMGKGASSGSVAAAHGAMVPGKAQVKGDSPKNDTVKAKLSPGEIVLPRSVTQSEDAGNKAKEFVESLKKQKESKEGKSGGYSKVLEAHRKLGEALKGLKAS